MILKLQIIIEDDSGSECLPSQQFAVCIDAKDYFPRYELVGEIQDCIEWYYYDEMPDTAREIEKLVEDALNCVGYKWRYIDDDEFACTQSYYTASLVLKQEW